MSTKVAVVIPVYRELNELEKISLDRCRKILRRYPLIFVTPEEKIFSYFESGDMVAHFPAEYFQSTQTYTRLMLSPFFYETFLNFEYILIYQLDAFVFYDALEEFCSLGYDYIGAPWSLVQMSRYRKVISSVGNGGFSLRNVKAHYDLVLTHSDLIAVWYKKNFPEDMIFSHCGKYENCGFKVAPVSVAYRFSAEFKPARVVKKIGGLPFGCHGWTKFSADFYQDVFQQLGYDLRPFRSQMEGNDDYQKNLLLTLTNIATNRLTRRIEHGQSVLNYLPTKRFASIRVIRSPVAMKILVHLMSEKIFLSDRIFFYDEETWTNLLNDLMPADLPHLVIIAGYDVSLVAALENRGLRYGEHVISFQREYIRHCEELIRKLGK